MKERCPACQAGFRGVSTCSRCGADLGRLMHLSAESWRLREAARQAVASGDLGRARVLAAEAQELRGTDAGLALALLCEWMA